MDFERLSEIDHDEFPPVTDGDRLWICLLMAVLAVVAVLVGWHMARG